MRGQNENNADNLGALGQSGPDEPVLDWFSEGGPVFWQSRGPTMDRTSSEVGM